VIGESEIFVVPLLVRLPLGVIWDIRLPGILRPFGAMADISAPPVRVMQREVVGFSNRTC